MTENKIDFEKHLDQTNGHLDLQDQVLLDEDILAVSAFIKDHPSVRSVNLSASNSPNSNQITETGCEHLARLNNKSSLVAVHISGNKIGNEGLKHLNELTQLTLLDISDTGINEVGLYNLKNLLRLISLDVSNNDLGTLGISIITTQHPNLRILVAQNCKLDDFQIKPIIEIPHLTVLDLSGNQLTDHCAKEITKMQSLCFIDISRNEFSPKGIKDIRGMNFSQIDSKAEKQFINATSEKLSMIAHVRGTNHKLWNQHPDNNQTSDQPAPKRPRLT